jgi:plasmid stabilization system protein ParE
MRLRWTERSRRDLGDIERFIARDDAERGRRWVARLETRARKAAEVPLAGRVVPEIGRRDVREVIVNGYRIVYLVRAEDVVILTVFESHRLLPRIR